MPAAIFILRQVFLLKNRRTVIKTDSKIIAQNRLKCYNESELLSEIQRMPEYGVMDMTDMEEKLKILEEYLPFWDSIDAVSKQEFINTAHIRECEKDTIIQGRADDCVGLVLVVSGRVRVFTVFESGRELTLYRLYDRDMCLFSASCIMSSIQFDVMVQTEEKSRLLLISPKVYKRVMNNSAAAANYTNQLMASRFSDVMWIMDQTLNKRLDARLAGLLIEESRISGENIIYITHDKIANHLASAREAVTRMLRYFQNEGLIKQSRGSIEIVDFAGLERVYDEN